MSMDTIAHVRTAYKFLPRSARHLLLVIASHQNHDTGWAWPSYVRLAEEVGLTRQRVIDLVKLLESSGVLEIRRGHGRGHSNFYRVIQHLEEKVKSPPEKRSNFCREKVKPAVPQSKKKEKKDRPVAHAPDKPERQNPFYCAACGYAIPSCAHRTIYRTIR